MKIFLIRFIAIFIYPFNNIKRKQFRLKYLNKNSRIKFVRNKAFYCFDKKPVMSWDYRALSDFVKDREKVAIVLQGPIKKEWDFTLETIKIYKKNFSGCKIIVSTWDTEDLNICNQIENLGAFLVKSSVPNYNFKNMNHQIISSQAGLKKAKELGCKYALKTRTDQRIYETNVPEYLLNMINLFPLKSKIKGQKQRLITTSFNTFKYRMYEVSDMFLFGHIDDVLNYWRCPFPIIENKKFIKLRDFLQNLPCEIYYATNFLERTGWKIKWTLADSWKAYADRFCIVDTVSVGLYWPKYSVEMNRFRNFFGKLNILEELTFKEWLDLYSYNGIKKFIPEYYIDNIAISSDELILKNNNIYINLTSEHFNYLSHFNLSYYKKVSRISGDEAFVFVDSNNISIDEIKKILLKYSIPIIYLVKHFDKTLEILSQNNKLLVLLEDSDTILNNIASLRLFPLKS